MATSSKEEVDFDGEKIFHIYNKVQGPSPSNIPNPTSKTRIVLFDEEDNLEYVPNLVDPSSDVKGKRVARVSMSSAKGKTKISSPPSINVNNNSFQQLNSYQIDLHD